MREYRYYYAKISHDDARISYDYARISHDDARISHDFDKSSFNFNAQEDYTGRKGDRGKGIGERNGIFCHG